MPAAATLAVLAAAAPNPCHDATPALRCPDLVTAPCGERVWLSEMRARQVIADAVGRRHRIVTGAELYLKSVPSRGGSYWKFNDAGRFELWAIDRAGHRTVLVRTGPELDSCLRELDRNVPSKIVRLPFKPGAQHCPRRAPPAPPVRPPPPPTPGPVS